MSYLSKLEFIIHPLSSFCSSDQEGLLKRGMPITTPIGSILARLSAQQAVLKKAKLFVILTRFLAKTP